MEFDESLLELVQASSDKPDLKSLRGIRSLLVSSEFASFLSSSVGRFHNEPEDLRRLAALLQTARFSFRDQAEGRKEQHRHMHALAIGGGSTLVIGTILAAATQVLAFLPLTLLPLGAGVYSAWRGSTEANRLVLEITALNDIVDLLDTHIHLVQKGDRAS